MRRSALSRYKEGCGLPSPRPDCWSPHLDTGPSSGQVDLYTLQKLLTHKSPTMTQRYAHLRDQALRQAADLAGNIIEQFTSGPTGSGVQV
jgi:integrase